MLKIIKYPSYNCFFDLIKESEKNIYLCAPFIKKDIVKRILENKKELILLWKELVLNFLFII